MHAVNSVNENGRKAGGNRQGCRLLFEAIYGLVFYPFGEEN